MTVRLNITLDEAIARKIRSYATRKKTSVSRIVEEQLEEVLKTEKNTDRLSTLEENKEDDSFREFLEKYAGSIRGNTDYDKAKDEYLKEKYGV